MSSSDRTILEKDAELETMRKSRGEQRDYFKKLEEGKLDNIECRESKLLVRNIKDIKEDENFNEDVPEMASVASKFSFFENHKEKEEEEKQQRRSRATPPRLSKSHIVS
jgi:hypothetical protein